MALLSAEMCKIRRLRLTWALLAVMVTAEILVIAGMRYWVARSPDAEKLPVEERTRIIAGTTFPGIIPPTLSFAATLGTLFAVILAARLGGDEYLYGTAKQMASMGLARERLILAKVAAVIMASLILLVGTVVASALFALVSGSILGKPPPSGTVSMSLALEIVRGSGIALFCLGFYAVFALFLAILTRSSSTATAVSISMILLEGNLVGSFASRFPLVARAAPYTIGRNITLVASLIEQSEGTGAVSPPDPARAFVVLGAWFVAITVSSVLVFRRQELGAG